MSPTSFVVVNAERCGSNMVRQMLESHERIACADELFNAQHIEQDYIGWDPVERDAELLALRRSDPPQFVRRLFDVACELGLAAFGCKLLYHQIPRVPSLEQFLVENSSIKVVHMLRRDRLARLVSMMLAQRTDVWWVSTDDELPERCRSEQRFRIDVKACVEDFARTAKREREMAEMFSSHDVLTLSYEDLVADPATVGQQLQEFLGVPVAPLEVGTHRLNHRSLASVIENLDEIRAELRSWLALLDDAAAAG